LESHLVHLADWIPQYEIGEREQQTMFQRGQLIELSFGKALPDEVLLFGRMRHAAYRWDLG